MMIGEFCPHCDKQVHNLYEIFVAKDYSTCFEIECPHCGNEIDVSVHAIPEFHLDKPAKPPTA